MRQFVKFAGLVVALGFAACSSATSGNSSGTGGAGGTAGSTSTGGSGGNGINAGGSTNAGGAAGSGGPAGSGGVAGSTSTGGSAGSAGGQAGGDGRAFVPANAQSCAGGLTCNGESCCTSIVVPGGTFPQGRSEVVGASDYYPDGNPDEVPEFSSTVSSFALDKYEVTVGRFRTFVAAYGGGDAGPVWRPQAGDGANPNVPTMGDASDNATGWQSAWNTALASSQAQFKSVLKCNPPAFPPDQTWTDAPGANENKPIVCVNWYEAFAFCIWDGGRLATESEWEYAAAGGVDNRLYPWGLAAPDCTDANFDNGGTYCAPGGAFANAPVGSYSAGFGKWGHADLAGNVWEWAFDWYAPYAPSASNDYANTTAGSVRVVRGGGFYDLARELRSARRGYGDPGPRYSGQGVRCARSAP